PPTTSVLLYGTLSAISLLAWALTGDATKTDLVRNITRGAHVNGYARYTVVGKDYPAVVKNDDDDACVDGLLLIPQNRSQRAKLDDFEGEEYKVVLVAVTVTDDQGREERVDAEMYVWDGDPEDISKERWDLKTFERERLDGWLELFGGMELVGHASDSDNGQL
ncbi:hypothetical protein OG21DRAFT_1408938, partial [Imleria badia]